MENNGKFVYQIVISIGILMFICIIGFMIWGENVLPDERNYTDFTVEKYSDGWSRLYEDGKVEKIKVPGRYNMHGTNQLTIIKKIDKINAPIMYVSFNSERQDVHAYVDDKLRYSYSTSETRLFGSYSPMALMFVPIYEKDAGRVLKIVFTGNNTYSGTLDEVVIGSQAGIVFNLFEREKVATALTMLLLLLGIIAIIISVLVKIAYNKTMPLFFAGWAALCVGMWSIASTTTRQFVVPNFSLVSYLTYISLMMLPYVIALHFDKIQEGRYTLFYMVLAVLELFIAFISMLLQFYNNTDMSAVLMYAIVGIVITITLFFITLVADFIQGYVKNYLLELVGLLGASMAAVWQIIYFKNNPTSSDKRILLGGILFMVLMSYVRTLSKVRFMERNMYAAAQAQEASTAFLTRMSHEMRTPINAILGMNKMILRESKEDNVLDYARDVNSAGNYLLSIVNEVLDLAKVNAGKIEIANEDYMLMDMVRECYSMVRPRAKASRLAFEVDMSDVLPSVLRGDRDRLIQVITNLLTNAVKYTPEGRIKLSIDGKISDGRLLLIIMVSDTGIGVEEENIPYLFDSFRRVGEFKNNKIEGTGLGLTITKQLVELMGGNIDVSSVYGKGTVFTVVVPQDIRSVEPCGTFSMGPNGDRRVADRNEIFDLIGRILVVDDVAINLRVFTMLLSNTDITVDTAISGAEALEKIKKQKYDIIFIDHLMPGMDGIELKTIMESLENNPNKDTPLIMQTANAVVGAKEEYERLGFIDYIEKPIKEEELRKMLRKYLK